MGEEIPDEMDVLRALAHPVRWGILQRLAAEPGICACDFTEFFDVSQPTISAHLKVLREAGLVTSKRIGTTICYSIAPGQLTQPRRPAGADGRHRRRGAAALPRPRGSVAGVARLHSSQRPSNLEDVGHACGRRRAVGPCLKDGGVGAFGDPDADVLRDIETARGHNSECIFQVGHH